MKNAWSGSTLEKLLIKFSFSLNTACQRFMNLNFPYIKAMSFHLIAMSHKG